MNESTLWESLGQIPESYVMDAMPPSWRGRRSIPRKRPASLHLAELFLDNGWVAAVLSTVAAVSLILALIMAGRGDRGTPAGSRPPESGRVTVSAPEFLLPETPTETLTEFDSEPLTETETAFPYDPSPSLEKLLIPFSGIVLAYGTDDVILDKGYLQNADGIQPESGSPIHIGREPLSVEQLRALAEELYLPDIWVNESESIALTPAPTANGTSIVTVAIYDQAYRLLDTHNLCTLEAGRYYVILQMESNGIHDLGTLTCNGYALYGIPFALHVYDEGDIEIETRPPSEEEEETVSPTDAPYRLEYTRTDTSDGYVAHIRINPDCREPFDVVIPSRTPDGSLVVGIADGNMTPYVPTVMSQKLFESSILVSLEAHFGMSYAEAQTVEHTHPHYEQAQALCRTVQTFFPYDLSEISDPAVRDALLQEHPLLALTPLYVLDPMSYAAEDLGELSETFFSAGISAAEIVSAYEELDTISGLPAGSTAAVYDPLFGGRINYGGMIRSVKLAESVTTVGSHAFAFCRNLTDISFAGVTTIGDSAFVGCSRLTVINLPASLTAIDRYAFARCRALRGVSFEGEALREIGAYAFTECVSLAGITLPEGLERIGNRAFNLCVELEHVRLPRTLAHIGLLSFVAEKDMLFIFDGPTSDWEALDKHAQWLGNADLYDCLVICAD